MKRSTARIVLLSATLVMTATGCVSPIGQPKTASHGSPHGSTQNSPPQPMEHSIAQVNYLANGSQACGCGGCGTVQYPTPVPCQYAMPAPYGWNSYGTDPQEFLCDGGDHHANAALLRDDSVGGLDPEDTIVHYTTEAGDIELKASNRVCIYAPRFGSVRRVTGAIAGGRVITASQVDRPQGPNAIEHELPGLVLAETLKLGHADVARRVDAMRERNRGVPIEGVLQPEQADEVLAALAGITALNLGEIQDEQKLLLEKLSMAAVAWTLDEAVEVTVEDLKPPTLTRDLNVAGLTIYEFPDAGRLRIIKLADRQHAGPGEIVSFSIQVVNVGDSPVGHVTITDNLTTRLEYVADSQTCSAGAQFETTENASESLQLTWKLTSLLKVGETATIRFRCKVR